MAYEIIDPNESFIKKALYGTGRTAARAAETAINFPGQAIEGIKYLSGKLGLDVPEGPMILPTDFKIGGEALQPKTPGEEKWDEFISDVTGLLLPIPGATKLSKLKAAGIAGAGQFSKWLASEAGGSEKTQAGVKLGTMLAGTLLGPTGLKDYRRKLYDSAEEAIPKNALISIDKLQPSLNKVTNVLKQGAMTPNKKGINGITRALQNKIKDGKLPVSEVWEFKRNLNEIFSDPSKLQGVEKLAPLLTRGLNDVLTEYGKENRFFLKALREADDITRGMNKASIVNKALQKHVSDKNIGYITGGVLLGHVPVAKGAKAIGAGLGVKNAVKGLEALKNSSAIRGYYSKLVGAALSRNTSQITRNLRSLDKAVTDEYPENKPIGDGRYQVID